MKTLFKTLLLCLYICCLGFGVYAQDNPTAAFNESLSHEYCPYVLIFFEDNSYDENNHEIVAWEWDFGDGMTSNEQHPMYSYSSEGIFTLTLTVWNDVGGSDTVEWILVVTRIEVDFNLTGPIECFNGTATSLNATAYGGAGQGNYYYYWSTESSAYTLHNISAGDYTLTVSDNFGCFEVYTYTVAQPNPIIVDFEITDPIQCYGDNTTSLTAIATGGTGSYYYSWDIDNSTNQINDIQAGNYQVTVTDDAGCSGIGSYNITEPDSVSIDFELSGPIQCYGNNATSLTAIVTGGTAPYSYYWNNDVMVNHIDYIPAGNYQVTVSDNVGCTGIGSYDVTQPEPMSINFELSGPIQCYDSLANILTTTASGGTSPYSYYWNTDNTTNQINDIPAGNYQITITDENGCTASSGYNITQPDPISVEIISSECVDSTGWGWLSTLTTGGSAPYTAYWNTGQQGTTISTNNFGLYYVEVMDINGCIGSDYDTLENNLCSTNIIGNVYFDHNENCELDEGESMSNVVVRASPGPYFSYTNDLGEYKFFLNPGTYQIDVTNRPYFDITCPAEGFQTVTISNIYDTINDANIGMYSNYMCSNLQVNISSGNLRPCQSGTLIINYINTGTITAEDAYIELELDELLSYNSSSIPLTSSEGNNLTFDIGTIGPGASGYFSIVVDVECNTWLIGTTVCSEAVIYPNEPCETDFGDWDHSGVMVEGYCQENLNACFTITNTGDYGDGDMQNEHEYRIFANDTLIFIGTFQLTGGEELEICWPTQGRAIRLEADQHPEHPGNSHPQETIENCGDSNGTSLGYITTVPYDDDDEFVDIYCRILTGSYDPNDKTVQPSGVTTNHYIDDEYTLNYQINFQNTGTDTAFTVVITDTISPVHDMSTFVNGVSSHPSTLEITGQGILKWTFEDILLPDSTTNEPESHGFVTYSIKLNEMTEEDYGTLVENNATIFFDFNEPVITNTTQLTFWELPIVYITAVEQMTSDKTISVYPNPASDILNIKSENTINDYTLIDLNGKAILKSKGNHNYKTIDISKIPTGFYFLKLVDSNNNTIIKKIIIE